MITYTGLSPPLHIELCLSVYEHCHYHGVLLLAADDLQLLDTTNDTYMGLSPPLHVELCLLLAGPRYYDGVLLLVAGDLQLLDTTKDLIHGALSSPHAGRGLANGEALDQQADDEFSSEVSAAIVDWIAKRMSDYHKNFHDTQLMQVLLKPTPCSNTPP